jgi:hypothetical protein
MQRFHPGSLSVPLFLGLLISVGCASQPENAASVAGDGQEGEHEPAFLLVQSSKSFEYDGERLTVSGTSPTTIYFSDRPDRIAGRAQH